MQFRAVELVVVGSIFGMNLSGNRAQAQTGLDLLTRPWEAGPHLAETFDDILFIGKGEDERSGEDIGIFDWNSLGRIKFDKEASEPDHSLGYRLLTIGVDSDIPAFPRTLWDVALSYGTWVNRSPDDWSIGIIGGAGTANDDHFSNWEAVYGIAVLEFAKVIGSETTLHVGIDYDGNRSLFPDVPLPYAMISSRLIEDFSFRAGLPFSGFEWRAMDAVGLEVEYEFPTNVLARASWDFAPDFSVFVDYQHTTDGFHVDDQRDRLFYDLDRASVGIHWTKRPLIDVSFGVGYAFDQEFARGFDIRSLDDVVSPSDEFLFFVTLRGTF
ncbi:MAG: hypothetical protein L0Y44_11025 [Phycisphaerales bacterium]|nr:hypothetical protein [Phycisphaerales bacterium]